MRPVINADWIDRFNHKVVAERVPLTGMLELTRRCNLQCVHCYLGEADRRVQGAEMSTDQVLDVIDQITAAGCLYLTITGGEPMIRHDFADIYRHAKECGLIVTVMCDGVLVTRGIVELFHEYPPEAVEVSVYGASAETYEQITRVRGSFSRCMRGIQRLVESRIEVRLKTVLMSLNAHEVPQMRALADDLGLQMKIDAAIFPCLHTGDRKPMDLRVAPEDVVRIEVAEPAAVRSWLEYLDRPAPDIPDDALYVCGAGVTGFYIDPYGYAYPCMMTTQYRYNLLESDFGTVWSEKLGELHDRKPRAGYECTGCELLRACASCPGFHHQEHGAEDVKSDYVCDTAKARWRALQDPKIRAAAHAVEKELP